MPAAAWLMNLDFAGGAAVIVEAADPLGLEATLPVNRLEYTMSINRLQFTLPNNRQHFTLPIED